MKKLIVLFAFSVILTILQVCNSEMKTGVDYVGADLEAGSGIDIVCNSDSDGESDSGSDSESDSDAINADVASSVTKTSYDANECAESHSPDIKRVKISYLAEDDSRIIADPEIVKEFFKLLDNQKYTCIDKLAGATHKVELLNANGLQGCSLTFNYNTIFVDRSLTIGKTTLKKGAYEAADRSWASFSFFLDQLRSGFITDPAKITLPAELIIPEQDCRLRMLDKGAEKVNRYEVYPMMYEFLEKYFSGKEFAISGYKKYYDYQELQQEAQRIKKAGRAILIDYNMSDTRFFITSQNSYKYYSIGCSVILSKIEEGAGRYVIVTDRLVFEVAVNREFDKSFDALFSTNAKIYKEASPEQIKGLFDDQKPYYMEYICSNLGIDEWKGREPDSVEIKEMKLNESNETFTVVHINNPFDLRMLVYKHTDKDLPDFIGDIYFRGYHAEADFKIVEAGGRTFVTGNSCKGHGTGVSLYCRDWYRITDKGINMVLSYPYDAYEEGPYGGYSTIAKNVTIVENVTTDDNKGTKVVVDYDVAKRYNLFLDISDGYGTTELKGGKRAEFLWDEKRGVFISEYPVNESGSIDIPPICEDIREKCDEILVKHYDRLLDNVELLSPDEARPDYIAGSKYRVRGVKSFLMDCSDSVQKNSLLNRIAQLYPDI